MNKLGRNDPCHCGSGKKYKKCCMKKDRVHLIATNHIFLEDIQVNGIATQNALPGEMNQILVRAEITSNEPEFYVYMKGFTNLISGRVRKAGAHLSVDSASALLLITHENGSADLYIHNIPMSVEILAKNDVTAGELVYKSKIADVRRVKLSNLDIKETDGVIFCFKIGWKFGLFFDIDANTDGRKLDIDKMELSLGNLYRRLSFEEEYDALGNAELFDKIVQAGWFPFIEILGGEFQNLLKAYSENFNIEQEEKNLLEIFDDQRINQIAERWWKRQTLIDKKEILESAFAAFKRKDPVACLKIILTEIEGIIQQSYILDNGSGTTIEKLHNYVIDKGIKKTGSADSLFFPNEFLKYLSEYTFASFDPKESAASIVSRHSVGHGAATQDSYTQAKALQAILALDQIAFYL